MRRVRRGVSSGRNTPSSSGISFRGITWLTGKETIHLEAIPDE